MLINSSFNIEKKINSNRKCKLTIKVNTVCIKFLDLDIGPLIEVGAYSRLIVDVVGTVILTCDRDRSKGYINAIRGVRLT